MSIEVCELHGVGMEQLRTGLLLKGPAVTSSPSIQTRFPFTHTAPEPLVPFTPHIDKGFQFMYYRRWPKSHQIKKHRG